MKKVIEFSLDAKDEFFIQLKNTIVNHGEFGFYNATPVVDNIIYGTIKTLKEEVNKQSGNTNGLVKFSFEKKENVYPDFHFALEENIDVALNRKIHTTTLERFTDLIEKFMVDTADKQALEKTIKVPALIDPDKEIQHLISYVTQTWDGFDKVNAQDFFKHIWNETLHATRNQYDQYIFNDLTDHFRKEYPMNVTNENGILIDGKLKTSELALKIMLSTFPLTETLRDNWDYEKNANACVAQIKQLFPDAKSLKPKGWSQMAKNYKDYEGMVELDREQIKTIYHGMDSGTAGSPSFEIRVALPHVMYDDKCQGRKPLEVLVGAILGHAYGMSQHNNSAKMLQEWVEFKTQLEMPGVKELNFQFKEPLNKALKQLMLSDEDNTQAVLDILGIDAKTQKKRLKF